MGYQPPPQQPPYGGPPQAPQYAQPQAPQYAQPPQPQYAQPPQMPQPQYAQPPQPAQMPPQPQYAQPPQMPQQPQYAPPQQPQYAPPQQPQPQYAQPQAPQCAQPPQMPQQPQYAQPPGPQYGAPPPGPMPGGVVVRDGKVMTGAILTAIALVLVVFTTLSHSWLTPKDAPEGVSGGMGLWSTSIEFNGRGETVSHFDLAKAAREADSERAVKAAMTAYGSVAFLFVNWILAVMLLLGAIFGFSRWASGKSAGGPFALTLIPFIVGVAVFVIWFVVSILIPEVLDKLSPGMALFLWWGGMICTLVAFILFAKGRSRAAFGAGFTGRGGGPMPPGSGVIGGPQMMAPGQGYIPNPADALGPPGGRPPGT